MCVSFFFSFIFFVVIDVGTFAGRGFPYRYGGRVVRDRSCMNRDGGTFLPGGGVV